MKRVRLNRVMNYNGAKEEFLMPAGDLNIIDVQWIIQYRIENPIHYLFQVRDTQKTICDTTEAELNIKLPFIQEVRRFEKLLSIHQESFSREGTSSLGNCSCAVTRWPKQLRN